MLKIIFEFDNGFYGDLLLFMYFDYVIFILLGCVFGFIYDCFKLLLFAVILDYYGFGCFYTLDFFIPSKTLNPSVS